ncbi:MAG: hypothetical protein ACLGHN_13880 [Bacteriovoracia bacterium]
MKTLIGLLTLALSFTTIASTVDVQTFVYDGSSSTGEVNLKSEVTHTEYRYESRLGTCFRQVIVGYRSHCRPGGNGYPPRCWSEPVYRAESYSCVKNEKVPYEVKDYDVDARILFDVKNLSTEATPGETFKVTLKGDALSIDAIGSKKFFIIKKKLDIRSKFNGSVKFYDGVLTAEILPAAPVLKSLEMNEIAVENGVLSFDIGSIAEGSKLGFDLKVEKVKTFGSDSVLLNRELLPSEVEMTSTDSGAKVHVDMNALGLQLKDGKFKVTAKVFPKFDGHLMNSSQYESLSASKTLIFKNR